MPYSNYPKPAKIFSQPRLKDLANQIYLKRENDIVNYSEKNTDNNSNRFRFDMLTANIDIEPSIRIVNIVNRNKNYTSYNSFAINYNGAKGVAVVLTKKDDSSNFLCNVRIMPLVNLSDLVVKGADSQLVTIDLEKVNLILKMDITISQSDAGEAHYNTHDIDTGNISEFITDNEILTLKKELEFYGAKIAAHYCQEWLEILLDENKTSSNIHPVISTNHVLNLPEEQLKEFLLAMTLIGSVTQEIVGVNAIKDIDQGWLKSSAFVGYIS